MSLASNLMANRAALARLRVLLPQLMQLRVGWPQLLWTAESVLDLLA